MGLPPRSQRKLNGANLVRPLKENLPILRKNSNDEDDVDVDEDEDDEDEYDDMETDVIASEPTSSSLLFS